MESLAGYDLVTMDLESWPLFGDQHQAWSSADVPLLCDIEDTVVQDWNSCGATSRNHVQYDCTMSEVLCNSFVPDVTTEHMLSGAYWPLAEGRKERYPSGDEALKTIVSPGELLYQSFPAMDTLDVDYELSQVVEDPLDVFGSEQFGTTESGTAVADNPNHITDLQLDIDCLSAQTDANGFFDEGNFLLASEPYVSIQTFGLFQQLLVTTPTKSEVSIVQEVPSSPVQYLLPLDDSCSAYDESLTDPAKVCNLLLRLSKSTGDMSHGSVIGMNTEPLLSPMSPEDVESILSVQDEELSSLGELPLTDTQLSILRENYKESEFVSKQLSSSSSRSPHHESGLPETRRMKKKEQNKSAALRYRLKKREEKGVVVSEVDQLQMRNNELKTRVEELNREIKYLRGLLDEIRSS